MTTTTTESLPPSSLHIDTNNNFQKWDSFIHQFPDFASPSGYTSKIRHRHYSVGSYYDHKTPPKTIYPNHTYHYLGSAPVSPLSRTSTSDNESHYHLHSYHSPLIYDNVSLNALRRVNPFLEPPSTAYSNIDHRRTNYYRSSSVNPESRTRVITYTSPRMTSKSVERPIMVSWKCSNEIRMKIFIFRKHHHHHRSFLRRLSLLLRFVQVQQHFLNMKFQSFVLNLLKKFLISKRYPP